MIARIPEAASSAVPHGLNHLSYPSLSLNIIEWITINSWWQLGKGKVRSTPCSHEQNTYKLPYLGYLIDHINRQLMIH